MRRALRVVLLLAAVAVIASPALAQPPTAQTLRVEFGRRSDPWAKPALEGYVYNPSSYRIGSILLKVQVLDGDQKVVRERTAWLYGNVASNDRGYFVVPILPDDGADRGYRITIDSFVLIAREETAAP